MKTMNGARASQLLPKIFGRCVHLSSRAIAAPNVSKISFDTVRWNRTAAASTMKGILCRTTGGTEVLEYTNLPIPTLKSGQVLIKNDYVGVNYIDVYARTGAYPSPKPEVLGKEGEGTVLALGPSSPDVTYHDIQIGDRVVWMGSGGYATHSAVPAETTYKIPDAVPPTMAVASLFQGLTALTLVTESSHPKKGDWAFVHAAGGGVGLWLCRLLKHFGVKVIGVVSGAAKRDEVEAAGADHVLDRSEEGFDLIADVAKLTGVASGGIDLVYDGVGRATWDTSLAVVRRKGSIVSFGATSGAVPNIPLSVLSAKNITLARPTVFNYVTTREEFEDYASRLFGMMIENKWTPKIHSIYPLDQAAKAHQDLESRKTVGKLLLDTMLAGEAAPGSGRAIRAARGE